MAENLSSSSLAGDGCSGRNFPNDGVLLVYQWDWGGKCPECSKGDAQVYIACGDLQTDEKTFTTGLLCKACYDEYCSGDLSKPCPCFAGCENSVLVGNFNVVIEF